MTKRKIGFDEREQKLIRQTVTKELTGEEHEAVIYRCERLGLDPLMGQVHAELRSWYDEKKQENIRRVIFVVGIDALRALAERTGEYAGQDAPVFHYVVSRDGTDQIETGPVLPPNGRLVAVTATIYRAFKGEFTHLAKFSATVYLRDYIQTDRAGRTTKMWERSCIMLPKCAEASTLRKGFPQDLAGVYVAGEIDESEPQIVAISPEATATEPNPQETPVSSLVLQGGPPLLRPTERVPTPETPLPVVREAGAAPPGQSVPTGATEPTAPAEPPKPMDREEFRALAANLTTHGLARTQAKAITLINEYIARCDGKSSVGLVAKENAQKIARLLARQLEKDGPNITVASIKAVLGS